MSRDVLGGVDLHPVEVPMRTRFRQVERRAAVLVHGPAGWGEFSPFAEYPPEVAGRWLAAALEGACSPLPEPVRSTVPVNVTVPAVPAAEAGDIVRASACSTAKVKVAEPGQSEADDDARVEAVRLALGPSGRIRIDANGAWDVATAVARIERLDEFEIEYVEQPAATTAELAEIRRKVNVPIAADESVRRAADPREAAAMGAADVYVLKVQPLGGVARTLELAASVSVPVVVSSALETSVGMGLGVWAAACLPDLPYACGLGTVTMLASDVVARRLEPVDGEIAVVRRDPDPELLDRHRPDRARANAMVTRLRAAAEFIA